MFFLLKRRSKNGTATECLKKLTAYQCFLLLGCRRPQTRRLHRRMLCRSQLRLRLFKGNNMKLKG